MNTEKKLRHDLAITYRLLAHLNLDDLTYTHLSVRVPDVDGGEGCFFIHPLGQLYAEVTPDSLLKVTYDGVILAGNEADYNQTGFVIHGSIYRNRPDVHAIIHLHTIASVSVACLTEGLLPLSQFALHFYQKVAYHDYDGLELDPIAQGKQLATDLGQNTVLFLRNHGFITTGIDLQEAFFYAYYLEQACRVQTATLAMNRPFLQPTPDVCIRAQQNMRAFEKKLGHRDWAGLVRHFGLQDLFGLDL